MDINLTYATAGTFAGTLFSIFLINYNPNPMLLILLPMWGLVFGIALAKVMYKPETTKKPTKRKKR